MAFLLRRLTFYLAAFVAAATINFFLPRLMPGDPIQKMFAGAGSDLSLENLDALKLTFGFIDAPLHEQYLAYLKSVFTGDLGRSIKYFPLPVTELLGRALLWTLGLVGIATLISFTIGTFLGVMAAWRRGTLFDTAVSLIAIFSSSVPAVVGGGSIPKPGEISMAHRGVLFLDELGEFRPDVINALRQPMESGKVTISRAMRTLSFDASFQLLAATNPCPCGNLNHPTRRCTCTTRGVERYRSRLGGPITDRFDMSVGMWSSPTPEQRTGETSVVLRSRVIAAREFAHSHERMGLNRMLAGKELQLHARLRLSAAEFLRDAQAAFGMSGRATDRILRVARSIADLAESEDLDDVHVAEALSMRHEANSSVEQRVTGESKSGTVPDSVPF